MLKKKKKNPPRTKISKIEFQLFTDVSNHQSVRRLRGRFLGWTFPDCFEPAFVLVKKSSQLKARRINGRQRSAMQTKNDRARRSYAISMSDIAFKKFRFHDAAF